MQISHQLGDDVGGRMICNDNLPSAPSSAAGREGWESHAVRHLPRNPLPLIFCRTHQGRNLVLVLVLKATVCVSLQVFSMNAAENCESKLKMLTAAMAGVSHAAPPGA